MIKISNVPCGYQHLFDKKDMVFVLLHKLLDNEQYRDYYLNKKIKQKLICLDNSCYELGESLDKKQLLLWANKLQKAHPEATVEIIIPDSYKNKEKTLKMMKSFLEEKESKKFKLMSVPQGVNDKELLDCLDEMLSIDRINTIGLNKLWCKKTLQIAIWKVLSYRKDIHKLGLNNIAEWIIDDRIKDFIRSADSRRICQLILGKEDIWEENLTEEQCNIIKNMINEVDKW